MRTSWSWTLSRTVSRSRVICRRFTFPSDVLTSISTLNSGPNGLRSRDLPLPPRLVYDTPRHVNHIGPFGRGSYRRFDSRVHVGLHCRQVHGMENFVEPSVVYREVTDSQRVRRDTVILRWYTIRDVLL